VKRITRHARTAALGTVIVGAASSASAQFDLASGAAQIAGAPIDNVWNTTCPFVETATDVFLFKTNNTDNLAGVPRFPQHQVLVPEWLRTGVTRRIVMVGDLGGMVNDELPAVPDSVRAIFDRADLVIGNLEGPLVKQDFRSPTPYGLTQKYDFHVSDGYLQAWMAQHCIDPKKAVFTVANNHAGDTGSSASTRWPRTVELACANRDASNVLAGAQCSDANGTGFVGVDYTPGDAAAIRIQNLGGMKVGLVGWTHVQNTRPTMIPTWEGSRDVVGRTMKDPAAPTKDLSFQARQDRLGLSMLIGMPHWDCQGDIWPRPTTVATAQTLTASGFDVIAGAHPSTLQGAQRFGDAFAFYGLGNMSYSLGTASMTEQFTLHELVVSGSGRVLETHVYRYALRPFPSGAGETTARVVKCPVSGRRPELPILLDTTSVIHEVVPFSTALADAQKAVVPFPLTLDQLHKNQLASRLKDLDDNFSLLYR